MAQGRRKNRAEAVRRRKRERILDTAIFYRYK